ncbi:PREDICTED: rop guanine nucleotide exchange factor 11 isoform X1 [Tarenaya hassleriana]|uniref:rop guanine nucleotide exchange factor 11 isoform X1 n=1 Tax=Tarenaya hassleriana TaxID=28532 RepID=UPI00053C3215|nr:PREDICTED: rop guanine nucleotide exchange factor 11 isoform X1 [Tarenaya hassleriana]
MVRAMEQEQESYKSRLFHFKGMNNNNNNDNSSSRHVKSWSSDCVVKMDGDAIDDGMMMYRSNPGNERPILPPSIASSRSEKTATNPRVAKDEPLVTSLEAMEAELQAALDQMKERFAKLLLGEDMSGGGKGVSSALALSNAITNLAASAFGEQRRLEPMPADRKLRWKREIGWLLSVTNHIVEFAPTQQTNKDGSSMEIMTTRQRTDLHVNIPALKKLDTMLIDCLDKFMDQDEFYYVSRDSPDSGNGKAPRNDEKWWLPTVKVPPNGLSEMSRRFLQKQKECVNQVLKAAMAINAQVLSEMEIPESYIDSLPKVQKTYQQTFQDSSFFGRIFYLILSLAAPCSCFDFSSCTQNGRASLGDSIYKMITLEMFDADQFLIEMDLSSEHRILDLKNRIEASIIIWKRKMVQKDMKSPWGSAVSLEKREQFEERAETILLLLKQAFPGISQSALEISKIQFNKDVGLAILESYSRVLESLAQTVLSRIEDVLKADQITQDPSNAVCKRRLVLEDTERHKEESNSFYDEMQANKTLFDFMQWDGSKKNCCPNDPNKHEDDKAMSNKKNSYLETLGMMRSPTARYS